MVLKVILYIFLFEHFLRFGMMMLNCKYFLVKHKDKSHKGGALGGRGEAVVLLGGGVVLLLINIIQQNCGQIFFCFIVFNVWHFDLSG